MAGPTSSISPTSPRLHPLPPILALVIGVDTYFSAEFPDLKVAVSDANAFEAFLTNHLKVPRANITSLRNARATRDSIISAFRELRDNVSDPREAAIVIYFAGHGARVQKPAEWSTWETNSQQIEMMCPADIGQVRTNPSTGETEVINGIPDRTIAVLLNHISKVKGDNVTLILDCCSSAGINRSAESDDDRMKDYTARQIANPPPLSPDCDKNILMHDIRSAGIAQGFSGKFHQSHVLLAACGRDQQAWESKANGHGIFTMSLLKILTAGSIDNLTYTSLMHKLDMPIWQTPHCEGQNVHRRLFNKLATGADGSFILGKRLGKRKEDSESYILQAGMAQGIIIGSKFGIHHSNLITDQNHRNPQRGTMVAVKVDAFSSELAFLEGPTNFEPGKIFYCQLTQRGSEKFPVYSEDRAWLESIFPADKRAAFSVKLVDKAEDAALSISVIDQMAHFKRNNPMVTPHIGAHFNHKIHIKDMDFIREVVESAHHFDHHLTRTGGDEFKNVWMELKELKSEYSVDFDQILTARDVNLIEDEPATVVVDESARLGMAIFNQTDLPLYPYLFWFDPTDLEIIEWYTPPFGAGAGSLTSVDAPLPPKSKLTVGYGDGGAPPWQFLLRPGEDKDLGFFKLFLTTSPADFSSISQESPFVGLQLRHGKPAAPKRPDAERWGTKLSTVIQVRRLDL